MSLFMSIRLLGLCVVAANCVRLRYTQGIGFRSNADSAHFKGNSSSTGAQRNPKPHKGDQPISDQLDDEPHDRFHPALFDGTGSRFAKVKEMLMADIEPYTSLHRLTNTFLKGTSSKVVLVGYGGSGKTETVNRAMSLAEEGGVNLVSVNFDLRKWYLSTIAEGERSAVKKVYNTLEHKKLQLSKLKESKNAVQKKFEQEIAKAVESGSKVVAFIDEVDLVGKEVAPENVMVLIEWLRIISGAVGNADVIQAVVLHPGPSTDIKIQAAMRAAGFPHPSEWIDFSIPYARAVQKEIAQIILPPPCTDIKDDNGLTLAQYFSGSPGANKVFLLNKNQELQSVWEIAGQDTGSACSDALKRAQEIGREGVGGKYVKINVKFNATHHQKRAISHMLKLPVLQEVRRDEWKKWQQVDMDGAASCGAIMKLHDSTYVMSPVHRDALVKYQTTDPKLLPSTEENHGHRSCDGRFYSLLLLLVTTRAMAAVTS